jgi:hypothetical protein
MNAALLKDKLEIFELITSKTEYGTIQTSYEHKYTTRAFVKFDSETMTVSEGEIYFPIVRTFIVRAHVPVIETDRIKWEDKWWRITSINKNKYYNDIEISCVLINE